ncbi:hypothetical protein [uncultured Friedmanniella sp.]|uniref:hypothetical protein n=1 Tax=uncultured Friedmanniella sp. TaxID=335381 RepID=UPI0035CABCBA
MTSREQVLQTTTITTTQDLRRLWASLMGAESFGRRTLWLVILDDDGRPSPVVMPIDDLPAAPTDAEVDSFGHFFDHLVEYGTPVLLLSRSGPATVQEADRQWALALAFLTPRWPVHLAAENAFGQCVITDLSGDPDGDRANAS